jgi:hypothetical protein
MAVSTVAPSVAVSEPKGGKSIAGGQPAPLALRTVEPSEHRNLPQFFSAGGKKGFCRRSTVDQRINELRQVFRAAAATQSLRAPDRRDDAGTLSETTSALFYLSVKDGSFRSGYHLDCDARDDDAPKSIYPIVSSAFVSSPGSERPPKYWGKRTVKVLPSLGALMTLISAECKVVIHLAIASPKPDPPELRLRTASAL